MLKMNVPAEAVRHRMEEEGVSSKIVEAVLGAGCELCTAFTRSLKKHVINNDIS